VGINLAIQDAVAAARMLAPDLRTGSVTIETLRRIQRRRWLPTMITQTFQRIAHRFVVAGRVDAQASSDGSGPPAAITVLQRLPILQAIPAAFVGIGALPEHAPDFARR
jgi:hypothetical protein